MQRSYNEIKKWIAALAESHSFLPDDCQQSYNVNHNISAYVSDPGTIEGHALHEKQVFRLGEHDKNPNRSLHAKVADRVAEQYGKELFLYCHMGKDVSMISQALYSCMTQFAPDFQQLLETENLYDTARHIKKLGLQNDYPGLARAGQNTTAGMLMKSFTFREGMALGVNIWQLLIIGTLIGNRNLHAKCSSDFSRHVLSVILQKAPRAATPGNKIPVRSFNARTGRQEYVTVNEENRPDFFLRPLKDDDFMDSGLLADCRADPKTGLLPEDVMHCGHLQRASILLSCKLWEVPSSFLAGHYSLLTGVAYALHGEGAVGFVKIVGETVFIRKWDQGLEEETCKDRHICDNWEREISQLGCIILPMIIRPCAAVWDKEKKSIGVLQSQSGDNLVVWNETTHKPEAKDPRNVNDNRAHTYLPYIVMHESDCPQPITALESLENIVKVGTVFWLKPHSNAWEVMRCNFPVGLNSGEVSNSALRVRINVPDIPFPDKAMLYVTTTVRYRKTNYGDTSCMTFPVLPEDLVPVGTPGLREIPFIHQ